MKNKQKANQYDNRLVISFYKKRKCWYAEVPQHTEAQNMMVSGADEMCEVLADGHKRLTLTVIGHNKSMASSDTVVKLTKIAQSNYGATYNMVAASQFDNRLPSQCWLCNVTKTVFGGNHPHYIDIVEVFPNDDVPYAA